MKKIILILIILLLGGCYDYNELTDLGIISSMIIDYKNDEYIVNLEVLEAKEDAHKTSFFMESKGKTFEEALDNMYKKSPKHIYFNHMYTVIISSNVANKKMNEIKDYFLIDADVRKDSYFVISDEIDKLLKFQTEDKLSIGESIKSIIEFNEKENSTFKTSKFREILHYSLNDCTYPIGSIKINDNMLELSDVYLLKDNEIKTTLNKDKVIFLNMLNKEKTKFMLETQNDTYKIYKYDIEKKIEKDKVKISVKADARLFGKSTSESFTKKELEKLESEISIVLKNKINESVTYAKNNYVDIYNFSDLYYKKYGKKDKKIFAKMNYDVEVKVTLNEKGLLLNKGNDNK